MPEIREKIRIAHIIGKMCSGGVESAVFNYYRFVDKEKYQFDFYYGADSTADPPADLLEAGAGFYKIPDYRHIFSYISVLYRYFRNNQYPIVHSHMNSLSVFPLYAAKKAGVPVRIAHNHSTAGKGETKKNILKYMLRPLAKVFPTDCFACSQKAGQWLFGSEGSFTVINNAIDLDRFHYDGEIRHQMRESLGLEGKLVIGHIGRFCYAKNHDFLLEIFQKIYEKRSDAVLLLVGEGELEQGIRDKVEKLGLEDCVRFLGTSTQPERFYQAMDVFLLPSRYEGLGMVSIEAQAEGLPCLLSSEVPEDAGILDSTVSMSGKADAEAWAEAALALAARNIPRQDQSEAIRRAGYDIAVEAGKLTELYDSLLARK